MSAAQPIATAPRDGRIVELRDEAGNVCRGWWDTLCAGAGWYAIAPDSARSLYVRLDFEPTHWTPTALDRAAP